MKTLRAVVVWFTGTVVITLVARYVGHTVGPLANFFTAAGLSCLWTILCMLIWWRR